MLKINGERLWASLMAMAEIGATARGGSCRLALSAEDQAGRALFSRWCEDAGLTLSVDAIGNLFARRTGTDPQPRRPRHQDPQTTGNRGMDQRGGRPVYPGHARLGGVHWHLGVG